MFSNIQFVGCGKCNIAVIRISEPNAAENFSA
jgi:hypothetical protein